MPEDATVSTHLQTVKTDDRGERHEYYQMQYLIDCTWEAITVSILKVQGFDLGENEILQLFFFLSK